MTGKLKKKLSFASGDIEMISESGVFKI